MRKGIHARQLSKPSTDLSRFPISCFYSVLIFFNLAKNRERGRSNGDEKKLMAVFILRP